MLHYTNSRWAEALWKTYFYSIVPAMLKKPQNFCHQRFLRNYFISSFNTFLRRGCCGINFTPCSVMSCSCQQPCVSNYRLRGWFQYRMGSQCSCDDRVNPSAQWQQRQPALMSPQRETQSNYVWCYYGVCSLLGKNHPIISWSESFQGITTIVTCNFDVAQMMGNVT